KEIKNKNEAVIHEKIQSYLTMASSTIRTQCYFIVHTSSNRVSTFMVASSSSISSVILLQLDNSDAIAKNAVGQQDTIAKIKEATQRILKCQQAIKIISNQDIKNELSSKIEADHVIIKVNEKRLGKLKPKKQKQLDDESIIEKYDKPERPLAAMLNPNLWDNIHDCIEFGPAHAKRQRTIIKVRTIKYLHEALEKRYNIYLSYQFGLASVARTDIKQHVNEYYCLVSVKAARVFAAVFASNTIVISQDNKAKISLGIPVVGHTFKTIQLINELVTIEDYNFSKGSKIKLIPSVYLLIDPNDSNTMLRSGQLTIFIRPEYFVGTFLLTHMADLLSLVNDQDFASVLLKENNIRLVIALDLDYLTVHTYVLYQSAYNPVEKSMASLSKKLAGITLPIDEYGMHLDSQENIVDKKLAQHNFEFSGNRLCELWTPDTVLLLDQIDGFLLPIAKGINGHYIDLIHALQYFDKLKIPQYDIDKTINLNFRVAEDVVNHDLLEDEISNSHEVQSENKWELIDIRIY
ncbi:18372_t:CDS:2, partial [Gigaspora margarita]